MSAASRKVAGPSQGQEAIHPSHALIPQLLVVNKYRQESGPGGWGHTCMLSLHILNETHTHHTCFAHMHSYTCSYTYKLTFMTHSKFTYTPTRLCDKLAHSHSVLTYQHTHTSSCSHTYLFTCTHAHVLTPTGACSHRHPLPAGLFSSS